VTLRKEPTSPEGAKEILRPDTPGPPDSRGGCPYMGHLFCMGVVLSVDLQRSLRSRDGLRRPSLHEHGGWPTHPTLKVRPLYVLTVPKPRISA
jgi:hypothetical protein